MSVNQRLLKTYPLSESLLYFRMLSSPCDASFYDFSISPGSTGLGPGAVKYND